MNKLFGFPMDSIMHVMLGAFIVITIAVMILAFRNRLFLKLGLRNIPRRRAQSILIVFGLMLSTLIVTVAFTAGDTFSYSLRSSAASALGGVDENCQQHAQAERPVSAYRYRLHALQHRRESSIRGRRRS